MDKDNKSSVFYGNVEKSDRVEKSDVMTMIGVIIVGFALGIVIFNVAALVGTAIGYMVWAFTSNGLLYMVTVYSFRLILSIFMVYVGAKMIYSWQDSKLYRNVFVLSATALYILSFIRTMM